MHPREARSFIRTAAELREQGMSRRGVDRAVDAGTLRRVHVNRFVDAAVWATAHAEERHLLRVVAVHDSMRGTDAAFVLPSAAVLHGLPLYRLEPRFVHTCSPRSDGDVRMRATAVARHRAVLPDEDRDEVAGIPCTSLERTAFDLARLAPLPSAVSAVDAAMRIAAWDDGAREYDESAAGELRARLIARVDGARGMRGRAQAAFVAAFADGRAQLPGESVSRLRLRELGFAPPRLQVDVPGPHGERYAVDFGLDDVDAWGEFDGAGKYVDPAMTGGEDPLEIVAAEKRRQDWIRGTTQRRFARWGSSDIASPAALAARLTEHAIFPPSSPVHAAGRGAAGVRSRSPD